MNFVMKHAPDAGSIAWPVDQQSSANTVPQMSPLYSLTMLNHGLKSHSVIHISQFSTSTAQESMGVGDGCSISTMVAHQTTDQQTELSSLYQEQVSAKFISLIQAVHGPGQLYGAETRPKNHSAILSLYFQRSYQMQNYYISSSWLAVILPSPIIYIMVQNKRQIS